MDFATILSPGLVFDWAIAGGQLGTDDGLYTAVALSLWSDRVANPDDPLPDSSGDRRGFWGDPYLPPRANGAPDRLGSRLWLLARALQVRETALKAQAYCQEALVWLEEDGIAAKVTTPIPTFPGPGAMEIVNIVSERSTSKPKIDRRFTSLWDMTRNSVTMTGLLVGGI